MKQLCNFLENPDYLQTQLLTYIGNKRKLLGYIGQALNQVHSALKSDKLVTVDLFAGSGAVSRYLKQHSSCIYSNDLETYANVINSCYLSNKSEFDVETYSKYHQMLMQATAANPIECVIRNNYSPKSDTNIVASDRAFYTNQNAIIIDSVRHYLDTLVEPAYHKYFLARLLIEASIHVNTSGVFKGFHKDPVTGIGKFGGGGSDALDRILSPIKLTPPVLSSFNTHYEVFQQDALELAKQLPAVDVTYLDPPYNEHPYGSNYFMLNIIANNKLPENISKISGIPKDWNHSPYNYKQTALESLSAVISTLKSRYIILSYNNEGFTSYDEMMKMLTNYGKVDVISIPYVVFRGGQNIENRSAQITEYIFILNKSLL